MISDEMKKAAVAAVEGECNGFVMTEAQAEAVLEAAERAAWLPIDTAPKDGTAVLLSGPLGVCIGSWGVCRMQSDGFRAGGGEPCWRSYSLEKCAPRSTHWRALPAAAKEPAP